MQLIIAILICSMHMHVPMDMKHAHAPMHMETRVKTCTYAQVRPRGLELGSMLNEIAPLETPTPPAQPMSAAELRAEFGARLLQVVNAFREMDVNHDGFVDVGEFTAGVTNIIGGCKPEDVAVRSRALGPCTCACACTCAHMHSCVHMRCTRAPKSRPCMHTCPARDMPRGARVRACAKPVHRHIPSAAHRPSSVSWTSTDRESSRTPRCAPACAPRSAAPSRGRKGRLLPTTVAARAPGVPRS